MTLAPNVFPAHKIIEDVYWVGAIDWELSDFHGYSTGRGSTYNAYLILDDKITLIDTVKAPLIDQMLSRIASVVELKEIDYIISNHSEMDHSGALPETIRLLKPEKVFASEMGVKALAAHFGWGKKVIPVKDGETLSLGTKTLAFIETRMLHWPDSMFTYLVEDKLLFSQDGFGMHLASGKRYADEIDEAVLDHEGAKYFANILLPYSPLVLKLIEKVKEAGMEFKIIAPDHGPIWRKNPEKIIERWGKWAKQEPTRKAVVVYDTMWGSTAKMARAIGEGLEAGGARPLLMPISKSHRSDVATELLAAGALLVGSPTINQNLFPTVADVLTYLRGLRPRNLIGAAFGSYGWGGEAVKQLEEFLTAMKVEPVGESLRVQYVPSSEELQRCYDLGSAVSRKLNQILETGEKRF